MPLYHLVCPKCGNDFEELASFSAYDAGIPCPQCGTKAEPKVSCFSFRGFFRWFKPSDYGGNHTSSGYLKPTEIAPKKEVEDAARKVLKDTQEC